MTKTHKTPPPLPLILGSASHARRTMLTNAGLTFTCLPADINEDIFKTANTPPADIAQTLATQKALHIAQNNPHAIVIGADQVLEHDGALLSKAKNTDDARAKLKRLRGDTHLLISAVTIARGDSVLWTHHDHASLTMHDVSDGTLNRYIDAAGDALTRSVGAYELEGRGASLFSGVQGDFFTILGMPLLPLLSALKGYGIAP